jgi:arylsulfatase A-like enzyme
VSVTSASHPRRMLTERTRCQNVTLLVMRYAFMLLTIFVTVTALPERAEAIERKPNIVLIYVDDLGWGDVGCYGATKVKTPNVDRLAREGLRFTDGHSASATCTPSRYALMTGEYPWRRKGTGILPCDAALIIEPGRVTLPAMLRRAGYATGVVGKWHLGLGAGKPDWNAEIKPGPLEIGFDSAFIIPATGDRVPCVYVQDHRVVGLDPADPIQVRYGQPIGDEPTGKDRPDLLRVKPSHGHADTIVNGISRIGFMTGGKAARWTDEDMADVITRQAVEFIERRKDGPFFLYFATHDIHVPRVPHKRFAGKSECGTRGDVIQEMDWCVGQILQTLDRLKLTDNTLVLFTSDNGPVLDDGYADGAVETLRDHKPAGPWRGGKGTPFEGGTRLPFILRWPAKVKPRTTSGALVCQIDLIRGLAKMTGQTLENGAAPDSEDVLAALLGQSPKGRETLIEQGRRLAIREGNWKFIAPPAPPDPAKDGAPGELYDLATDPAESKNLAADRPELAKRLAAALHALRKTPGPAR